jgi:hypothetical protein
MSKEWFDFTKEELLKLPQRKWDKEGVYMSVLFVNTKRKHDSGYNLFAIIGCEDGQYPTEICGYMDDFRFYPCTKNKDFSDTLMMSDITFDCSMKGVFRMHSRRKIHVGSNTSTTTWWLGERV